MQENSSLINKDYINIVCFSLSRWDAEISSPAVSLAREFAKKHRVFFIEHPFSLKDVWTGKTQRKKATDDRNLSRNIPGVEIIRPPNVLPINFLPPGALYNFFSGINNRILTGTLRKTIREYNILSYLFINFFDPFFLRTIPADIKPVKYVYQCMDDLSQVPYTRRHGVELEESVIRSADLVLCTSSHLTRLKSPLSDKVRFHPNAADFSLFNNAAEGKFERRPEMDFGDKKVIGFMGSIEYRTDFELLKKIATHHQDKVLFLVGPIYGDEHLNYGLDKMQNVVFAGAHDISVLPAYLQYFDCAIIPYKKNVLTASIYPLKINEYLAAGKPVVSTDFSIDIQSFSANAYVVGSHEQFIHAIDRAINENDAQKRAARIAAASQNTWQNRVEEFWKLLS